MARRRLDDEDAYATAYFAKQGGGRNVDDVMGILGLLMKQEESAQNRALNERQQAALEAHQQGQLDISRGREAREERESGEAAAERKTERETGTTRYIQSRMDAADALARETEKQRLDQDYKNRALGTERLRRLVEAGVVPATIEQNGKVVPNPVLQKMYEKIDPDYADVSAQVANEQNQAKFATIEKANAIAEAAKKSKSAEIGPGAMLRNAYRYLGNIGPNIVNSLGGDVGTYQYEGGAVPAPRPTAAPPPVAPAPVSQPTSVGYGGALAEPVGYDYGGTRPRTAAPIEEPIAVAPREFGYEEGYPSAQPNYQYGIETPIPADVYNRIEADPRYKSAEEDFVTWLQNLVSQPRARIGD